MVSGEWGEGVSERLILSYRDLTIWQDGVALAALCYRQTSTFPPDERYGLTAQIRRAASSVPANIAEGHGREHTRQFIQFLRIAQGSLKEVETHFYVATEVGLMDSAARDEVLTLCDSLGRRVRKLIRTLQDKLGDRDA